MTSKFSDDYVPEFDEFAENSAPIVESDEASRPTDAIATYYELLWSDAKPAAAKRLKLTKKYQNSSLSDDEHNQLMNHAQTLVNEWHLADLASGKYRRFIDQEEGRYTTQHDPVVEGLRDIKSTIERTSVASNVMSTAQRHPFLVGVLGNLLFGKLMGK